MALPLDSDLGGGGKVGPQESPVLSGSCVLVVIDADGQIKQEFESCSVKCARNNFGNGMWQAA